MSAAILMDQFELTRIDAMYYTSVIALGMCIISCTVQLILPFLSKLFTEFKILIFCVFLPLAIGSFMLIPFGDKLKIAYPPENFTTSMYSDVEIVGCPVSQKWCLTDHGLTVSQYIISRLITSAATVLGLTLLQIILTKSIGKRLPGLYMGYLSSVGSVSRIISPLCVTTLYATYGLIPTFSGIGSIFLSTAIWLWIIRYTQTFDIKLL